MHEVEGFSILATYNTDYSSHLIFLAMHVLCRNNTMKKVVKTNTVLHCKADNTNDLVQLFYLDSLERN